MTDIAVVLKSSVQKNLNVPGLVNDIIDQVLEPALVNAIAKTETKIDDIILAAVLPKLKEEVKALVDAQWKGLF